MENASLLAANSPRVKSDEATITECVILQCLLHVVQGLVVLSDRTFPHGDIAPVPAPGLLALQGMLDHTHWVHCTCSQLRTVRDSPGCLGCLDPVVVPVFVALCIQQRQQDQQLLRLRQLRLGSCWHRFEACQAAERASMDR